MNDNLFMSPQGRETLVNKSSSKVQDVWPGITKTEGVVGGDACIAGTRISVSCLEEWRRLGQSNSDILESYPRLREIDLENAWSYVAAFKDEIDAAILDNEAAMTEPLDS